MPGGKSIMYDIFFFNIIWYIFVLTAMLTNKNILYFSYKCMEIGILSCPQISLLRRREKANFQFDRNEVVSCCLQPHPHSLFSSFYKIPISSHDFSPLSLSVSYLLRVIALSPLSGNLLRYLSPLLPFFFSQAPFMADFTDRCNFFVCVCVSWFTTDPWFLFPSFSSLQSRKAWLNSSQNFWALLLFVFFSHGFWIFSDLCFVFSHPVKRHSWLYPKSYSVFQKFFL